MNMFPMRHLSLATVMLIAAFTVGCGGSKLGPAATADAAKSPSPTPQPAIQYSFYKAESEQSLKQDTDYGYLIAKTKIGAKTQVFTDEGLKIVAQFNMGNFTYYHLQKDSDLLATMERLKTSQGVIFVEPDTILSKDAGLVYDKPDPRSISEQYALTMTHLKEAWTTYGFGPNRPTVVDLDTGINFGHEDLKDVVTHAFSWWNLDTNAAIPVTSYDIQPIDYIKSATWTSTDADGHGSHTAGTIAASGNNGKGVAGVCWNADLVSYKVFGGATGAATSWSIYGSLYHLANWKKTNYPHTIPVNMSLGGLGASQFAIDVIETAVENNIVICASMGNSGNNLIQYPAGYAGVIAVGATTGADKRVNFSSTGRNISVTAPGNNIISTYNGSSSDYFIDSGTSMSAPFVTGLVAYMLTFAPDLDAAQIKSYLEANTDLIEGDTGYNERNGWGRVNVLKTIAAVVRDTAAKTQPTTTYVYAPLAVHVQNSYLGSTNPLGNVVTNLYSCDAKGVISNYVASSLSDASAVAYFNLLKPGYYMVGTSFQGSTVMGKVFQVEAGHSIPDQTISYQFPIWNIATLADAGTALDANGVAIPDSIITLYNAAGAQIATIDSYTLDTLQAILPPGTYTIKITTYNSKYGEYALFVSPSTYPFALVPGNLANPIALGSLSHAAATPQAIVPLQAYNGILSASADYYQIVIP